MTEATTMNLQPSITKEQLNDLEEKYPKSMKIFKDWYIKFRNQTATFGIAFEGLPQPVQLGIWIEFVRQRFNGDERWILWATDPLKNDLRSGIEYYFKELLEPHLKQQQ